MEDDRWEVIVGNIGTVYDGPDKEQAEEAYWRYVEQSKLDGHRASGEEVNLLRNGEIEMGVRHGRMRG